MNIKNARKWCWHWAFSIMSFLILLGQGHTVSAGPAVLGSPVRTSDEFEFSLTGESPASYVVEASTDLQIWSRVATNDSRGIVRLISVTNIFNDRCYFRVNRAPTPLFRFAIAVTGAVTLTNGATVDSFDSSDTNYSTNGRYDLAKRRANGDVVTNSKGDPAIDIGNGHIYGTVNTGPGGIVTTASGGSVGDISWINGIEPGWLNHDMYASYPDVVLPSGYQLWLPLATAGPPSTNTYVLSNGNYSAVTGLNMTANQTMLVQGNCKLYIDGDFRISASSGIYIAPGATLKLYAGGTNTTISGVGIVNEAGLAASFAYFGLPTNTQVTYLGASDLVGTVCAPQAAFAIYGGVSACGAWLTKSINMGGGTQLHYDESLARTGPFY